MGFDPKYYAPFGFAPPNPLATTIADMARALYPHLSTASPPPPSSREGIAALLARPAPPPASPTNALTAGFASYFEQSPATVPPAPPRNALVAGFGAYFEPTPTTNALAGVFGSLAPGSAPKLPVAPPVYRPAPQIKERSTFFSFYFDEDIHRSVIVRNAWRFADPEHNMFRDSSMWEKTKVHDAEKLKRIIRASMQGTSVVCVLTGSMTHSRRFVRYEIANAIIDGRGLLTVHLNSIRHHQTKTPHTRGVNPLSCMAVGKVQQTILGEARYYLFEKRWFQDAFGRWEPQWVRYQDYTPPVKLPPWLNDPRPNFVTPLSDNADEYDYMAQDGYKHIGNWLDRAARRAGRC
jgi:hypothetical protein